MKVSRVEEMRAMDRHAIREFGIPEHLLMENAGKAVLTAIETEMGVRGRRFAIFCGTGNNGGDGIVVARQILSNGGDGRIWLLGDEDSFKGAAKLNLEIARKLSLPIKRLESIRGLAREIQECDAVIDAIFGTGITREVEGLFAEVIKLINRSGKPVLSVDVPSGINGDNGNIMGVAVEADYTVSLGLPKLGNLLYPGFECGGKLFVSHISFPPSLYNTDELRIEINSPSALPQRNANGHKGDFGDVLVISGAANYYGAPYFCASSFLRAGGGYSRLATPRSVTPSIASKGSEIVFHPQPETRDGTLAKVCTDSLLELSELVDMVILGPGLSLNDETQALVRDLVPAVSKPLLIDGDGLTAISGDIDSLTHREAPTVLTPHIGEMARITGASVAHIKANRIGILQEWSERLRVSIVLKGAHSLIGDPEGRVFINMSGNSGMATAGSGDVLTGTIAAAFGLGLELGEAVKAGVFLHGLAGDMAAESLGADGMTAQSILDYLAKAVKSYRQRYEEITACSYGCITII